MSTEHAHYSAAISALHKHDGPEIILAWTRIAIANVRYRLQGKAAHSGLRTAGGWDIAVFHHHTREQMADTVTALFDHAIAAKFGSEVETEYGPKKLTYNAFVSHVNRELAFKGVRHRIKISQTGWVLGRDEQPENHLADYAFILVSQPANPRRLRDFSVIVAEKSKGNDSIYRLGRTTLDEVLRRPSGFEYLFHSVRAAGRVRKLLPQFRDAAAPILVREPQPSGQVTHRDSTRVPVLAEGD